MANEHHWAIVVGIDQYPGISDLVCAQRDAQSFHDWLYDTEGGDLPQGHVTLISKKLPPGSDLKNAQPTINEIFDAIEDAFNQAEKAVNQDATVWENTRLYLYFSGHGIARDAVDSALLAADASPGRLGRHVSCKALQDFFMHKRLFKELIIFADCCRDDVRGKVVHSFLPWTLDGQVGGNSTRLLFACASEFGQKAYEEQAGPEKERKGYFTRCLIEALNNRKDTPVQMPGDMLRKRMKGLLANLGNLPTAPKAGLKFEAVCINEDEITLGVTSKTPLYLVEIDAPAQVSHLRLIDGSGAVIADAQRALATEPFTTRVPMGVHEIESSRDGEQTFQRHAEPMMVVPGYNRGTIV